MPRLNIRKFKRDASYDNDTIAFTTPVSFPSATVGGIDVGAALASGHAHGDTGIVYVDSKQTGTYTETGHESAPYRTLTAAIAAKLTNVATQYTVFKLLPGNYVGAISVDKDTANQSFEIVGSGRDNTFIRSGATFSAGRDENVLYFRDFLDITIRHVSIQNGKYGFYPRNCRNIKVIDCEFKWLGSEGVEIYHDQSQTMASQAAYWAGNQTSNGGTCRIRSCEDVLIDGCRTSYSLRGVRIQDCLSGLVTNTRGYKLLESFIYLASGSYDGNPANGCSNFVVSNCSCDTIFHSGVLCIGGHSNSFINVSCTNCASSPFNTWHANDVRIISCSAHNCLTKTYIGIGVLGDNYGQVYKAGATNVTNTDGYELTVLNCTFTQCGTGRSASGNATTFYLLGNAGNTSSRVIIDGNNSDATVEVFNPDELQLVNTKFPALMSYINTNSADIGTAGVAIAANTTNITSNDVDIASLMTTTTANATAIAGNDTDIASLMTATTANSTDITANTTALAGKQATLSWSTVGDNDTNPVQSKDIKTYVDANAGGGSGASLSSNTFTGTQTVQPASGAAVLELKAQTGAGSILQLAANPYGGASLWVGEDILSISGDRVEVQATVGFRIPRHSSAPSGTNNASFGCLYADTSGGNSACKLYFHNGTTWKEVTLS